MSVSTVVPLPGKNLTEVMDPRRAGILTFLWLPLPFFKMAMYGQLGGNILAHQSFRNDFLQSLLELESQMYYGRPCWEHCFTMCCSSSMNSPHPFFPLLHMKDER